MNNKEIKFGVVIGLIIVVSALSRIFPHPWGFTPIIAVFMFAAAYISNPVLRMSLPFAVVIFSDVLLQISTGQGFHQGTVVVYGSYLLISFVSFYILNRFNFGKLLVSSLLASILFYLITNFAFFYPAAAVSNISLGQYSHDLNGIKDSYLAALPFFRNAVLGDLFFSFIIFGSYQIIRLFSPKLA